MNISRFVLMLNALVFGLYGVAFVISPETLSLFVTGSAPTTPSGMIDMRATYGGMSLAIGALLLFFSSRDDMTRVGLATVMTIMLGMAFGRLIGIVLDGGANAIMYVYLFLEIAMALLAVVLIQRQREI